MGRSKVNWYLAALKNYVGFSGRARRTEFWMFVLFNVIIEIVLAAIGYAINDHSILLYVYAVAVFLPGLALWVRRLHDQGKSGLWLFIGLIPFVGGIWLLVLSLTAGTP